MQCEELRVEVDRNSVLWGPRRSARPREVFPDWQSTELAGWEAVRWEPGGTGETEDQQRAGGGRGEVVWGEWERNKELGGDLDTAWDQGLGEPVARAAQPDLGVNFQLRTGKSWAGTGSKEQIILLAWGHVCTIRILSWIVKDWSQTQSFNNDVI